MEFEDMKKIWDAQNSQALYAIDEKALQKKVQRKSAKIRWNASCFEFGTIISMLGFYIFMNVDAYLDNAGIMQYLSALLVLPIALHVYLARKQRLQKDRDRQYTLLDDIENAIQNVDLQVHRLRVVMWWYMLPLGIIAVASLIQTYATRPWWAWLTIPLIIVITYWIPKIEINKCHLPKKRELENLRNVLMEPGQ